MVSSKLGAFQREVPGDTPPAEARAFIADMIVRLRRCALPPA